MPGHIKPPYVLDEPASNGRGDIAPLVKLTADEPGVRGRIGNHGADTISGTVDQPVTFNAWIEHPDNEVWVGWAKHSGPGSVYFDNLEYRMQLNRDPTQVQARFSEPGSYVVRMQTIDSIAAFEFYCCHSNAYFNVEISN